MRTKKTIKLKNTPQNVEHAKFLHRSFVVKGAFIEIELTSYEAAMAQGRPNYARKWKVVNGF